jgi:ketosteroid isomerase-like protein
MMTDGYSGHYLVAIPGGRRDLKTGHPRVVERYHHALAAGDSSAALALLAPEAVVIEGGGLESLQEYRSHHLPSDIAFVRGVKTTRSPVHVTLQGDVAWTNATSATRGTYRGKTVNSTGAESMVLTRGADGWVISAIHWSSRDRSRR